jgi:uncharacterized phage-associated protein
MTNLKLQKLLYYTQGFHLAMQGGPLFPESLLAWNHGPVVQQVWRKHRHLGFSPIGCPEGYQEDNYAPEIRELLDAVYATYGQFTAKKLEQMTHEEPPWAKTTRNRPIDHGLLQTYFLELVRAGKDGKAPAGRPVWPTNSFRFQGRLAISESMAPFRERFRAAAAARTARVDG